MYLAYYILRIYKEEKSNANQYYQTILYIYGIGVVVIPVILWIAGIISSFASSNEAFQVDKMMEMLMNLEVFSSIILVSVSFLIVSFVRDNKMYIVYTIYILLSRTKLTIKKDTLTSMIDENTSKFISISIILSTWKASLLEANELIIPAIHKITGITTTPIP